MKAVKSAAQLAVDRLLLVERGLFEIDQSGGVDVDVEVAGGDFLADQVLQRFDLLVAIRAGVLLGVELDVIALEESGPWNLRAAPPPPSQLCIRAGRCSV